MTITFDVSKTLERILVSILGGESSIHSELSKIKRRLDTIMGAIENLRSAVDSVGSNTSAGFSAIQSAMEELATDIANLPQNADVEAEAQRLSAAAQTIADGTAQFAQNIRDAIPTETPTGDGGGGEDTSGGSPVEG
jgi:phage-related protein